MFSILFALAALTSCSTSIDRTQPKMGNRTVNDPISVNTTVPFGCASLLELTKGAFWPADTLKYGHLQMPAGKILDSIQSCTRTINSHKTIAKPALSSLELIPLAPLWQESLYSDSACLRLDSCLYRLPDQGGLECYYFLHSPEGNYGVYGSLLFLDPTNGHGQVANIYFEVSGEQHIQFRYFHLTDQIISLFEASYYDDGCLIVPSYDIRVSGKKINVMKKSIQQPNR